MGGPCLGRPKASHLASLCSLHTAYEHRTTLEIPIPVGSMSHAAKNLLAIERSGSTVSAKL